MAGHTAGIESPAGAAEHAARQVWTHVDTGTTMVDEHLLFRIRAEFEEMPGLCLTRPQAARLWNLDRHTCDAALELLIGDGFLSNADDGRVLRRGRDAH